MNRKVKILYVDDEPINLKTFQAAFKDEYDIITAQSGEEGLVLFDEHVADNLAIVISDQQMPGMRGVDFLVKILQKDPVPIRMILTAYADFQNVSEAVNKGYIFQFIQKPWAYKLLKPLLRRAVEFYQLAKDNLRLIHDLGRSNDRLLRANKRLEEELHNRLREEKRRRSAEIMMLSQAKLASMGEMATGIAHEINQPLSYINIILQSALNDIDNDALNPDEFQDELAESIKQVSRITGIIDHLRTFGRSDISSFSPVDLEQTVYNALIPLRQRLRLANIELLLQLDPGVPPVLGSSTQIEQVLINLIMNAVDALVASPIKQLKIRLNEGNGQVFIEVEDTGSGVIDAHIDKIFEPFFTTKEVGQGTGVGLAIAYGIVKEHKGTIVCRNQQAIGTTFVISLPPFARSSNS